MCTTYTHLTTRQLNAITSPDMPPARIFFGNDAPQHTLLPLIAATTEGDVVTPC